MYFYLVEDIVSKDLISVYNILYCIQRCYNYNSYSSKVVTVAEKSDTSTIITSTRLYYYNQSCVLFLKFPS